MRLAFAHDHLTQQGGAERVVLSMMAQYPETPLFTLVYNQPRVHAAFAKIDIRTSYLQHIPGAKKYLPFFLSVLPMATESLDLSGYDVVVSSTSSFAKGIIVKEGTKHICYCHTPTRYLWSDAHKYVEELPYPGFVRIAARMILPRLRAWDRRAADRPDVMLANSRAVQERIKKYYGRDSTIVYPPVSTGSFAVSTTPGSYFLTGGRLVAYKRFDIVIEAFNRLRLPLKIFGTGPDRRRLMALAKSNISFLGFVPEESLSSLYQEAIAFLHPQEEDFGITAVEAMACGKPVIAYAAGGALETVEDGQSGTFFDEQSWEALADTLIRFVPARFNPLRIRQRAEMFDERIFQKRLGEIIQSTASAK